jgi:hypothetical protein
LIAVWFAAGPYPRHQAPRQAALRHEWRACADVVLAGDSSVAWVLDPAAVEAELPNTRVVNFGYVNLGIADDDYLDATEHVLDPRGHGTVVLGINATDLSPEAAHPYAREGKEIRAGRPPAVELDWRDELDLRSRPRGLCAFLWNLCKSGSWQPLGANGFMPMTTSWRDETDAVPDFIATFEGSGELYPDTAFEPVLRHVRDMRARGVDVIAYIDGGTAERLAAARGFDPGKLARRLTEAGAVVMPNPAGLRTFDGEHFDARSADQFAHALGRLIATRAPARDAMLSGRCAWPVQSHP